MKLPVSYTFTTYTCICSALVIYDKNGSECVMICSSSYTRFWKFHERQVHVILWLTSHGVWRPPLVSNFFDRGKWSIGAAFPVSDVHRARVFRDSFLEWIRNRTQDTEQNKRFVLNRTAIDIPHEIQHKSYTKKGMEYYIFSPWYSRSSLSIVVHEASLIPRTSFFVRS